MWICYLVLIPLPLLDIQIVSKPPLTNSLQRTSPCTEFLYSNTSPSLGHIARIVGCSDTWVFFFSHFLESKVTPLDKDLFLTRVLAAISGRLSCETFKTEGAKEKKMMEIPSLIETFHITSFHIKLPPPQQCF